MPVEPLGFCGFCPITPSERAARCRVAGAHEYAVQSFESYSTGQCGSVVQRCIDFDFATTPFYSVSKSLQTFAQTAFGRARFVACTSVYWGLRGRCACVGSRFAFRVARVWLNDACSQTRVNARARNRLISGPFSRLISGPFSQVSYVVPAAERRSETTSSWCML